MVKALLSLFGLTVNSRGQSQTGRERGSGYAAAADKECSQPEHGRAEETARRGMQSENEFYYIRCIGAISLRINQLTFLTTIIQCLLKKDMKQQYCGRREKHWGKKPLEVDVFFVHF